MVKTHSVLARLRIGKVKMRYLQVVKNTKLARNSEKEEFGALPPEEYIKLVSDVVKFLLPKGTIQRLWVKFFKIKCSLRHRPVLLSTRSFLLSKWELTDRKYFQGLKSRSRLSRQKC